MKHFYTILIYCCFFLVLWGGIPVLSVPLLLYFAYSNRFNISSIGKHFLLLLVALSFGLVAYTVSSVGIVPSDVVRYRDMFEDSVGSSFGNISPINYFFNIINWILANYVSNNSQFLSLFWSTLTMLFVLLSSVKLIAYLFENKGDLYFILIITCLVIVPFITTTEMIKQTAAFSIFMYALSKKITNDKHSSYYFLLSFLIHPVSILLVFIVYYYNNKYVKKYIYLILSVSLIFSFINILDILSYFDKFYIFKFIDLADKLEAYKDWTQWGGSKRYYIIFGMMVLQVMVYLWQYYRLDDFKNDLSILGLLIVSVLLFNMSNQHDFARLIFILFPFQIIVTLLDIKAFNYVWDRKAIVLFLFSFYLFNTIIYTYNQLHSDESRQAYMDNNLIRLLTSNVFQFFQYHV